MNDQSIENTSQKVPVLAQFLLHQVVLVQATQDLQSHQLEWPAIHPKTKVEQAPQRKKLIEEKILVNIKPIVRTNNEVG